MASSTEELRFRAVGQDVSAGRMFDRLADKADDAKDEVRGLDRQMGKLDEQLDLTKLHLAVLVNEFDRTGDKTLFKDIRRDRSTIGFLEKLRAEFRGIGDDSDKVGKSAGGSLVSGITDTLSGLPSLSRGTLIAAAVGIGVVMSPFLGSVLAAGVLGAPAGGGIIGGLTLAARDERVQAAGKEIGQRLLGQLEANGQSFVGPLLVALDELGDASSDLLSDLSGEFRDLSNLVAPLSRGLSGLIRNIGPGLSDALEKAEPAIRVIADELPELGESISYALSAISDQSDGAIMGLTELFNIIEYGIEFTGDFVAGLSAAFEWLVRIADAASDVRNPLLGIVPVFGLLTGAVHDETSALIDELDKTKSSTDTYVGSVYALGESMEEQSQKTRDARQALVEYGKSLQDQFDPTANLVHRLQDVKDAQKNYSDAVKEHGKKSQEAKDAELKMAEAILAAHGAALAAQGTFDGKFSPALRKILTDGGLAEEQIRDIEAAFNAARVSAEKASKTYKAQLILDTSKFYGSLAAARNAAEGNEYVSGRASGGDVKAGRTYMVGEQGPELVTFGADGYVHDAASTQAMLSGATGGSAMPTTGGSAMPTTGGGGWGGGSMELTISVRPGANRALVDALVEALRIEVRTTGGGSVNTLLER